VLYIYIITVQLDFSTKVLINPLNNTQQ